VLSSDDSALQVRAVRAAGALLDNLGIGVVLRHPPTRPALDAAAAPPSLQQTKSAAHAR
jgi:hypothetical protein